jgi:hypothetical protein
MINKFDALTDYLKGFKEGYGKSFDLQSDYQQGYYAALLYILEKAQEIDDSFKEA